MLLVVTGDLIVMWQCWSAPSWLIWRVKFNDRSTLRTHSCTVVLHLQGGDLAETTLPLPSTQHSPGTRHNRSLFITENDYTCPEAFLFAFSFFFPLNIVQNKSVRGWKEILDRRIHHTGHSRPPECSGRGAWLHLFTNPASRAGKMLHCSVTLYM